MWQQCNTVPSGTIPLDIAECFVKTSRLIDLTKILNKNKKKKLLLLRIFLQYVPEICLCVFFWVFFKTENASRSTFKRGTSHRSAALPDPRSLIKMRVTGQVKHNRKSSNG